MCNSFSQSTGVTRTGKACETPGKHGQINSLFVEMADLNFALDLVHKYRAVFEFEFEFEFERGLPCCECAHRGWVSATFRTFLRHQLREKEKEKEKIERERERENRKRKK